MKLSDLNSIIQDIILLRDGEFDSLGLLVATTNMKILSFIEDIKYIDTISDEISCLICTPDMAEKIPSKYGVISTKTPRLKFFEIHNILAGNEAYKRKQYKTTLGENCNISELAVISKNNVTIGNNVTIEEFVIIRENTVIRDNCIIRAGSTIGGEGFEFKRNANIDIRNVKHCGGVVINSDVEIQYNTCIDKAIYPWDNTVIGEYTKISNLVYIAHGVKVGDRCLLAANSSIGGRTIIGEDSWLGISATVSNGLILGKNARVSIGAVVTKNINVGETVSGNFAIEHGKFINFIKSIR